MFSLNPNSGVPIYRQIMEQAQRMVASGQIQPGDYLPSVRELAKQHAVNPMTISKAYGMLESEGLLIRQRGKGMQVADRNIHPSSLDMLQPALDQLVTAARQLNLSQEEIIAAVTRTMESSHEQ